MFLLLLAAQLAGPDYSGLAVKEARRDPCKSRDSDEVVVCARSHARSPFSVTDPNAPFDVHGNVMSVMREHEHWGEGGGGGIQSCGPVGPGGWTGCMLQQWRRNDQQNPRRR